VAVLTKANILAASKIHGTTKTQTGITTTVHSSQQSPTKAKKVFGFALSRRNNQCQGSSTNGTSSNELNLLKAAGLYSPLRLVVQRTKLDLPTNTKTHCI
jgi:hypothetical protein